MYSSIVFTCSVLFLAHDQSYAYVIMYMHITPHALQFSQTLILDVDFIVNTVQIH